MTAAYLCIIRLSWAKQRFQRVVGWDKEPGKVDEEPSSNIEENKEEVNPGDAEESVDLGNRGLLLKVVEYWVFG
jgi:hypothetical protein